MSRLGLPARDSTTDEEPLIVFEKKSEEEESAAQSVQEEFKLIKRSCRFDNCFISRKKPPLKKQKEMLQVIVDS